MVVSRGDNSDLMTLQVVGDDLDMEQLQATLSDVTRLKGSVEIVDSLPNDGKVIDDQRDYSG